MKQAVRVQSLLLITTLPSSPPKNKRFAQLLQCFARVLAQQSLRNVRGFSEVDLVRSYKEIQMPDG